MSINVEEATEDQGVRSTMYRELGAHVCQQDGIDGTHFAVWAPNAREVSVICDRNGWHHGQHLLYPSDAGIWRGFYAHLVTGESYKYSIRTHDDRIIEKADPYAFRCENRPQTASIVADLDSYDWSDGDWLTHRATTDWFAEPISIYEVQLGSWRRP
jgi:1,4-alpha-glucan branching enzyme